MDRGNRLFFNQNFDHFFASIFDRFGVVLGRQLGVIFRTFGGQDRPRSVQNASWKPINMKIVNFAPVLRFPLPERCCWPQDGLQNAPRSAQDGSKRLLKSNFFALENRLKFGLVLGSDFGRFIPPKKLGRSPPLLHLESVRFSSCVMHRFKMAQEPAKRLQDPPKGAPRGSKRPPRAPQEASTEPQETPRAGQEGYKPAQELPRASQDAHKAFPKHLARQPFSENSKNSNHGSKRHRSSPISMNPKGLASNRRMKKGGRAAVIPLGEVNPPPAP